MKFIKFREYYKATGKMYPPLRESNNFETKELGCLMKVPII